MKRRRSHEGTQTSIIRVPGHPPQQVLSWHIPEEHWLRLLPALRDTPIAAPGSAYCSVNELAAAFPRDQLLPRAVVCELIAGEERSWMRVRPHGWPSRLEGPLILEVWSNYLDEIDAGITSARSKLLQEELGRALQDGHFQVEESRRAVRELLEALTSLPTRLTPDPHRMWDSLIDGQDSPLRKLATAWRSFAAAGDGPLRSMRERILGFMDDIDSAMSEYQPGVVAKEPSTYAEDALQNLGHVAQIAQEELLSFRVLHEPQPGAPSHLQHARFVGANVRAIYELCRATTRNSEITGGIVESYLRTVVADLAKPLVAHSGGVVGLPYDHQVDCILWDPNVRPAILVVGESALVDSLSVRGLIEIKSSTRDVSEFAKRIHELGERLSRLAWSCRPPLRVAPCLGILAWTPMPFDIVMAATQGKVLPIMQRMDSGTFVINERAILGLIRFVYRDVMGVIHPP